MKHLPPLPMFGALKTFVFAVLVNVTNMLHAQSNNTCQTAATKTVNSILLEMAMLGTTNLSPQQLSTLQGIAAECPYTEGTAVYDARVLVAPYDSTDYENSCETEYNIENNNGRMMQQNSKQDSDVVSQERIEIYPNPADGLLNIFVETSSDREVNISFYSIEGQLIIEETYKDKYIQINVRDFPMGMYIVKIRTDNIVFNKKIVINH